MNKININMKEENRKGQKRQQISSCVDRDNKGYMIKIRNKVEKKNNIRKYDERKSEYE